MVQATPWRRAGEGQCPADDGDPVPGRTGRRPSPSGRPPRPWPRGVAADPALSVGEVKRPCRLLPLPGRGHHPVAHRVCGPGGRPSCPGRRSTDRLLGRRFTSRAPAARCIRWEGGWQGSDLRCRLGSSPLDGGGHRSRPPGAGDRPAMLQALTSPGRRRRRPAGPGGPVQPLPVGCPQRAVAGGLSHPAGHLHGDRSRGPGPVRPKTTPAAAAAG